MCAPDPCKCRRKRAVSKSDWCLSRLRTAFIEPGPENANLIDAAHDSVSCYLDRFCKEESRPWIINGVQESKNVLTLATQCSGDDDFFTTQLQSKCSCGRQGESCCPDVFGEQICEVGLQCADGTCKRTCTPARDCEVACAQYGATASICESHCLQANPRSHETVFLCIYQ